MKRIVVFLMTLLVFGCAHEYRNVGRLTGKNFDGVVLRYLNGTSTSSWAPSKEDILTLEAMLPSHWESLRKVEPLRPLSEYKRYYLPKSQGPRDHRIDVWFFHESVGFVENGKWLSNYIDLRSKISTASYDLGFDCDRRTFMSLFYRSAMPPNKSLQPTPPAPLQSPALQTANIHFEKQNTNQLSSFVLGEKLAKRAPSIGAVRRG